MRTESLKALGAVDIGPLEQLRQRVPDVVGAMTQIVVDNPGQIALITAGSMVAAKMALNLMKPRTPAEAIALFVVLQVALPRLAWAAVEKGWLTFRIRDEDGNLIPLPIGGEKR